MKRIQIYIEQGLDQALALRAACEGSSKAALIRDYVADRLGDLGTSADPLDRLVGRYELGGGPDSESVDYAVYRRSGSSTRSSGSRLWRATTATIKPPAALNGRFGGLLTINYVVGRTARGLLRQPQARDKREGHHVSQRRLHRYLSEFNFRWNAHEASDSGRAGAALKQSEGKRLRYRGLS